MVKKFLLLALTPVLAMANHYPSGREIPVPFPPNTSPAVRHFLSDIACGADQCLVAWTAVNDAERFGYDIRAARISKSGQLLDMTSIKIASASYLNTTPPQVVALKSDYVVFYSGILYARVSREGIVNADCSIELDLGRCRKLDLRPTTRGVHRPENRSRIHGVAAEKDRLSDAASDPANRPASVKPA